LQRSVTEILRSRSGLSNVSRTSTPETVPAMSEVIPEEEDRDDGDDAGDDSDEDEEQ
jgi:hypothetical protein